MALFSKVKIVGLLSIGLISFSTSASSFFQVDSPDAWLSLARLLGGGAVGIFCIIAITRLIQALKNQPLDGQKVTAELLAVIQKLDLAITVMNTTTRSDHERMLKHDEDFMRRLEIITSNEAVALGNQNRIIENQASIVKQLDRLEAK